MAATEKKDGGKKLAITYALADKTLPGFDTDKQEDSNKWKQSFFFIQAADTQLGLIDRWTNKIDYPKASWQQEMELCRRMVDKVNAMEPKPKFAIICGDLIDRGPDATVGGQHPDIRRDQERDFKAVFAELDPAVRLVCVCGNHDVGDEPTHETIKQYRESFGYDMFSFWIDGVCFIVLNSQYYKDSDAVADLVQEQDEWLAATLNGAQERQAKHILVFQHVPPFVSAVDEDDAYFNIKKAVRKEFLDLLIKHGVRKLFCGHYHKNNVATYNELEIVTTTAVGQQIEQDHGLPSESGVRVVTVKEDQVSHAFYPLNQIPAKVSF